MKKFEWDLYNHYTIFAETLEEAIAWAYEQAKPEYLKTNYVNDWADFLSSAMVIHTYFDHDKKKRMCPVLGRTVDEIVPDIKKPKVSEVSFPHGIVEYACY